MCCTGLKRRNGPHHLPHKSSPDCSVALREHQRQKSQGSGDRASAHFQPPVRFLLHFAASSPRRCISLITNRIIITINISFSFSFLTLPHVRATYAILYASCRSSFKASLPVPKSQPCLEADTRTHIHAWWGLKSGIACAFRSTQF